MAVMDLRRAVLRLGLVLRWAAHDAPWLAREGLVRGQVASALIRVIAERVRLLEVHI